MKMKKILAAVAAAAMLATCTACSADSGKIKIGISKMMTHDAMDRAENGFIDALNANGYDDTKVEIDAQNGQGETSNLNTIATQFVGDNVDLIFAIATPAAQGQTINNAERYKYTAAAFLEE